MSGYFTGTDPDIGLGDYAYGNADLASDLIVLGPSLDVSTILVCHGGIQAVNVQCYCHRTNLGDAEWWLTQKLVALASSTVGVLAVEDNLDRPVVWDDALFVRGTGVVEAFEMGVLSLDFVAPERASQPGFGSPETGTETETWSGAPAEPDEYADRTFLQDYEANGQTLGVGPLLSIGVDRRAALRVVPRCSGARFSPEPAEAGMTLEIVADLISDTEHWQVMLEDLVRDIGTGAFDLTGNGNTWGQCRLRGARPEQTDAFSTTVTYTFARDLS